MKSYSKTIYRSIRKNISKLISVTSIILLGVAFVSGLGTLSYTILNSFSSTLLENNVPDLIVKTKSQTGFSSDEIDSINNYEKTGETISLSVIDLTIDDLNTRTYYLDSFSNNINKFSLIEGSYPTNDNEVLMEQASDTLRAKNIGDEVLINNIKFKVCGIVSNPLIFTKLGEYDNNLLFLDQIFYIKNVFNISYTDVYVDLNNSENYLFSNSYKNYIDSCITELNEVIGTDYVFLSLKDNASYALLENYCDKVDVITFIFPLFFILVASLVVLTSMTRMVEEERMIIGCYSTLGFSNYKIILKYVLFSLICSITGSLFGVLLGIFILPNVIYPAFNTLFFLPLMSNKINPLMGILSSILIIISVIFVTIYVIKKSLKTEPARLLLPKSPKEGKKIFLERINIVWSRLSFKYKSSFRNVFRNINHLLMTIISVAGATALVFAGFALLDVTNGMTESIYNGIRETLEPIAIIVIIFALLLCVFVIYNLTNMNIGERNREIATLKVLGYYEREVTSYIYREVLMMSIMGIIVGLPLGYGLISFIIKYLEMGSIKDISALSFLNTSLLVILFIIVVDLLLLKKILKVDMSTSLKSVD